MKKSVALFLYSLNGGGSEKVLVNIANGLVNKDYKVDIVLINSEGDYKEQLDKRINIKLLNSKRAMTSIIKLAKYMKKNKPDVMITPWCHMDIIALIAKKISNSVCKILITEHTVTSMDLSNSKQFSARFLPKLIRKFYPKANHIVAVSKGVAKDLSEIANIPIESINVIYNPLVNDEMKQKSFDEVNHEWFKNKEKPIIISVGRLSVSKDFTTLIKAFYIVKQNIDARLVILGEGEDREKLENLVIELGIENDVYMPGFDGNPYRYMRKSDVFAFPSRWEGLGNVIVEALACGIPVVSSDCPIGPREILEDGKHGCLVEVGNEIEMAKKIINILNLKKVVDYSEAIQRFKYDVNIEKYIKVIES